MRPDESADQDTLSIRTSLAHLRAEQRRRWLAGERILAETYLHTHPSLVASPEFALDLIFNEFLLREKLGEHPDKEEYLSRFPDYADLLSLQIDLHLALISRSPRTQTTPPLPDSVPLPDKRSPVPTLPGYEILGEIGRGGMGVVYQARQVALKRLVAIKMLLADTYADLESRERFLREAEAIARLQHPHIVQIHEVGQHNNHPYLSLEYVAGGSLADKLDGTPWPAKQAAALVETIARAVDHAHQRGIIHRDLKPANVLLLSADAPEGDAPVTPSFSPKITDFGLARIADDQTHTATGAVLGTPSYMAPEQAGGESAQIGPLVDVYAVGAILYELVTGRPPFRAATTLETLLQVREANLALPRVLNPSVPRDLETIILKCLAKEPPQRYTGAGVLAEDLKAFCEDRPVTARRPSVIQRCRYWLKTSRLNAGAVILLIVLFLTFGWFLSREFGEQETAQIVVSVHEGQNVQLPLVGEILAATDEERSLQPFSIPTYSPITVPATPSRIRIHRPGCLSGTYWLNVRGSGLSAQVWQVMLPPIPNFQPSNPGDRLVYPNAYSSEDLFPGGGQPGWNQQLWPQPLNNLSWDGLTQRGKQSLVLTLNHTPRFQSQLSAHEAATGKTMWNVPLAGEGDFAKELLRYFGGHPQRTEVPPLIMADTLVFGSERTATVLAVSAQTGKTVWTHTGSPSLVQPKNNIQAGSFTGTVRALGPRKSPVDANQDGIPDLASLVLTNQTLRDSSLQMHCGKTGTVLWKQSFHHEPAMIPKEGFAFAYYPELHHIRVRNRSVIAILYLGKLHGYDAVTGQPVWKPTPVGYDLIRPPQFVDVDGDGEPEVLLVHEEEECRLTLTVRKLPSCQLLWAHTWDGIPEPVVKTGILTHHVPDWPLVADLDGDGKAEVILREAIFEKNGRPNRETAFDRRFFSPRIERMGVRVLEGSTGEIRWQRRLARSCYDEIRCNAPFRIAVGLDLDKDGIRDLTVATLAAPWSPTLNHRADLYVDTLSGVSGQTIWTSIQRLSPKQTRMNESTPSPHGKGLAPMQWWETGKRKFLIVPVELDSDHRDGYQKNHVMAYVLDRETGRQQHTIPSFVLREVRDLDGDGRPEVLGSVVNMMNVYNRTFSCVAIRGIMPEVFAQLQQFTPAKRQKRTFYWGGWMGKERTEEDPSPVRELMPQEDPRIRIPLPWARNIFLRTLQDENFLSDVAPKIFLLTFVVSALVIPVTLYKTNQTQKRRRLEGISEEEIKARVRQQNRFLLGTIIPGLVITLTCAGIWLWIDSATLSPDERYEWRQWYLPALFVWVMLTLILLGCRGAVYQWRRHPKRKSEPHT